MTVGRCEWCGVVSHRLVDAECETCADKVVSLGAERRSQHDLRRLVLAGNLMAIHLGADDSVEAAHLVELWERCIEQLRRAATGGARCAK